MRGKGLLAALLLGVGLCFMPALGHGEVEEWIQEVEVSGMDLALLRAEVRYIMHNPTSFLNVELFYDPDGRFRFWFPEGLDTKQKICARVQDTRGIFSNKSSVALREEFQEQLEAICGAMRSWFTDMDTDVVAMFYSGTMDSLGYFYQGEYHLLGE